MNEIYGRYSRSEIRDIYSQYYDLTVQLGSVDSDPFKVERIEPWCKWYEIPYAEHLAKFALVVATPSQRKLLQTSSEAMNEVLADFFHSKTHQTSFSHLPDEVIPELYGCFIAIRYQMQCLAIFSESVSSLIDKARNGNDTALFEAILVDSSIVAGTVAEHRIARAQLENDKAFKKSLCKAILGTKPRRPLRKYDDLRYMIEVLQESFGGTLNAGQLYEVLVDDLELYPDGSDYSLRSFQSLIRKRNVRHETRNAI